MDEAIRNAAVFGALALACGSLGWLPRWGGQAAAAVALGSLVTAVVLGVIDPTAPALWVSAWPVDTLLLLVGWGMLGLGLRRLGGVGGFGAPLLGAFLGGAAFGALPVILASTPGRSPRGLARLTLAAAAGGLCGPLGSAPMLLLLEPGEIPLLWRLAVPLTILALAGPSLPDSDRPSGRAPRVLMVAAPLLWLVAVLASPCAALLSGLVLVWGLVAWQRPSGVVPSLPIVLRVSSVLVLVLLLVPAGVLDFLAWGLDDARILLGGLLDAGFGLAALGLAALAGGPAVGLAGLLTACSDPVSLSPELRAALVAGAAVGGQIPALVLAGPGALGAALGRWSLAVALLFGWLALLAAC